MSRQTSMASPSIWPPLPPWKIFGSLLVPLTKTEQPLMAAVKKRVGYFSISFPLLPLPPPYAVFASQNPSSNFENDGMLRETVPPWEFQGRNQAGTSPLVGP